MNIYHTSEGARVVMNQQNPGHWNRWGPFLSGPAWGTVREDYSSNGEAWDTFRMTMLAPRAYRWNEDGIAGPATAINTSVLPWRSGTAMIRS